jgi:FKBP-type peptidyl-prolyl cis-trans isomerase SlyD
MQIAAQTVVTINYTLKNPEGQVLDSSEGREPLAYLHGVGNIVPGLEQALEGKGPGDKVDVTLAPEQGYGVRDERLVRNVPIRKLVGKNPKQPIRPGDRFQAQTEVGPRLLTVLSVKGDYANVDANHPLAGQTLCFAVEVVGVREATAEEKEHGHVHGPGGHQHG